jgi:inorganic pyrophosphatase
LVSCGLGFIFGIWNLFKVLAVKIELKTTDIDEEALLEEGKRLRTMNDISEKIQKGATTFLFSEYIYLGVFLIVFGVFVLCSEKFAFYTFFAFILGALTSLISGYIGMFVATRANVRTTFQAFKYYNKSSSTPDKESLKMAFDLAFRGGCVMGFSLVSLALAILCLLIIVYKAMRNPESKEEFKVLFEYVAGYGLGGSTVALFCRVGGGISTKAADVGADLVGKNLMGFDEDSPKNPATIADNVGDNVGDIAGMGSDLFGSFAESTCASLVISASSPELMTGWNFLLPLILSAAGILVSIITSFFATNIMIVDEKSKVERTLKGQIIISTVLLTPVLVVCTLLLLPDEISNLIDNQETKVKPWGVMVCALSGLWSGLIIGYITDYYTSNAHSPCQKLSKSCKSGAAINIIDGLALG